ncbi:MAG: DUF502 domain-containing protein [Motiliproteus sp.]
MKTLVKYFFQGILVMMPLILTGYLIYVLFSFLNDVVFSFLAETMQRIAPGMEDGGMRTALALAVTIVMIIVVGMVTSHWLGRKLLKVFENILERIPLVKLLYGSIRDLLGALIGEQKSFDQPVYVEIDAAGAKLLGFVTSENLAQFGLENDVAVYLPQSYNFAGNLVLFPRERVVPIKATSADVTTFVLSGGVSGSRHDSKA